MRRGRYRPARQIGPIVSNSQHWAYDDEGTTDDPYLSTRDAERIAAIHAALDVRDAKRREAYRARQKEGT